MIFYAVASPFYNIKPEFFFLLRGQFYVLMLKGKSRMVCPHSVTHLHCFYNGKAAVYIAVDFRDNYPYFYVVWFYWLIS